MGIHLAMPILQAQEHYIILYGHINMGLSLCHIYYQQLFHTQL